ncbi:MAG TPA: S8 family serine peptidase [Gammaproteobacteria bacterium]|nr:S8 family serine peptidase [Gammaproteobacteria bacterium]
MRKAISFVLSSVMAGMLLDAGIASAHSGHHHEHHGHGDHHHSQPDAKLLEPRSLPYALPANSGEVDVTFSVPLVNEDDDNPQYVYLVSKDEGDNHGWHNGQPEVFRLNDQGHDGDRIAGDSVYSATVRVNPQSHGKGHHHGHDECLNYRAFARVGDDKIKSPEYGLCTSSFPVGVAPSNTSAGNLIVTPQVSPAIADELLVRFDADVSDQQIRNIARFVGAQVVGSILPRNLYQFKFPRALTAAQMDAAIRSLLRRPGVEDAYQNRVGTTVGIPSDPEFVNQHGLQLINADDAWDLGATGAGVTVTLLDTGVQTHADLPTGGTDTANHGTAVAGVIAAITNNSTGIAGVAYNSTLQKFTVSPDTVVTMSEMVAGFQAVAATSTGQVVTAGFNITLAPPGVDLAGDDQWDLCAAINDVVLNSGTPVAVVISGAGNDNSDGWHYPSKCNDSSAPANGQLTNKSLLIPVMASVSCTSACTPDTRVSTSNYGAWIDVAAPGQNIRSTNNTGGYSNFTGTSMAMAHVAGTAAQMISCGATVSQIQSRLISTAPVTIAMPGGGSKPRIDSRAAVLAGNTAPTGITGGSASINEGTDTGAGYAVGTLSAVDANLCDQFSFSIQGGADSAAFSIGGPGMNQLTLTAGVLDFETKSSYNVTVRVTDAGGLSFDQPFVVSVNDLPEPTFTIYSVRATYLAALGGAPVLTQNFDSFAHEDNLIGFSLVPGITVTSNMDRIIAWDGTSDGDKELFALDSVGNPTRTAGTAYYDILVTGAYNAIGFDITAFNPATPGPGVMQVFFLDGTSTSVNIFPTNATEQDPVFFGVTSNQRITRIRWNEGPETSGTGNEETTLDDFAVANLP